MRPMGRTDKGVKRPVTRRSRLPSSAVRAVYTVRCFVTLTPFRGYRCL